MTIELEGFAVYPDQIAKAHEWMAFLRTNQAAVDRTLGPEHLQSESLFSATIGGRFYLFWYSEQTAPGQNVAASTDPIDVQHVAYWQACIDESVPPLQFTLENHFTPPID
ncbi:DUF6176 family protein [Lacticaseibacillus daqingensis]|uniref:DUF6176 family protein n=1 Tax=Lacticaseibacillus daqingensis TaxID=2486014 RepID=UPI000F7AF08F|nr:DUF6176 family protein [Lacticaseibacillus daqingensis]